MIKSIEVVLDVLRAIMDYNEGPPCQCFDPLTSKFVFTRPAQIVCLEDTMVYTGLDKTSLHPV